MQAGIVDPINNFQIEFHQYLDQDYSGKSPSCVESDNDFAEHVLSDATKWLSQKGWKGILGEIGGGDSQACVQDMKSIIAYVMQHRDVWTGILFWAAGPWWRSYFMSLEPDNGLDRPMMTHITQALQQHYLVSLPPVVKEGFDENKAVSSKADMDPHETIPKKQPPTDDGAITVVTTTEGLKVRSEGSGNSKFSTTSEMNGDEGNATSSTTGH